MRWDFGFTCAFCLLHEADFHVGRLGEGLGVTTIEHRVPQSTDPSRAAEYGNCLYCCRLCNVARSNRPIRTQEARLLDPTSDVWADHFEADGEDRILPVPGDADAAYTHRVYDLDDPLKTERRRLRRILISDRVFLIQRLFDELNELLLLAEGLLTTDVARVRDMLQEIRSVWVDAQRALTDLERFAAIPRDAPEECRCRTLRHHSLPAELEEQTWDISDEYFR